MSPRAARCSPALWRPTRKVVLPGPANCPVAKCKPMDGIPIFSSVGMRCDVCARNAVLGGFRGKELALGQLSWSQLGISSCRSASYPLSSRRAVVTAPHTACSARPLAIRP